MMKRALFPALACLLAIAALFSSSCSTETYECRCNCEDCLCMPSDHMFSIPTRYLFNIAIAEGPGDVVVLRYGDDRMDKAVEILNAFVPESEEELSRDATAHYVVRLSYYDAWRRFGITDSSVIIFPSYFNMDYMYNKDMPEDTRVPIKYTGKPGCLQGLIDLFENGEKMPDPYVEEEENAGSLR